MRGWSQTQKKRISSQKLDDSLAKNHPKHGFVWKYDTHWYPPKLLLTVDHHLPTHRIHGAAIYDDIYHQYTPVMLAYIYHTWILWVWTITSKRWLFWGDHQTYPKHPAFGMPFLDKWDRCSCNQPLSPTPLRWPWQPHDSWVEILPIPIYIDLIFWLKCKCVTNVLAKNHHKIVICNPFSCFNHHESSNFLEYLTFLPAIFLFYSGRPKGRSLFLSWPKGSNAGHFIAAYWDHFQDQPALQIFKI